MALRRDGEEGRERRNRRLEVFKLPPRERPRRVAVLLPPARRTHVLLAALDDLDAPS